MKEVAAVASALQVGARRAAPPQPGVLAPLAPGLEGRSPEERLLLIAGALDAASRAGFQPATAPAIPPCPAEPKPVARHAEQALLEALESGPAELLVEWIAAASQRGWVAPPTALPGLLALDPLRVPGLRDFVGERGRWMAALLERPEWAPPDPADTAPSLSDWETLDWREKQRLLAAWSNPPAAEDAEFLALALSDKRKEVRAAAADLLVALPGSDLRVRLETLAREHVSFESKLLGKRLAVRPIEPKELPAYLPRTTGVSGFGPQALALVDLVRFLPPDFWCELLQSTPAKLVRYAEMGEDSEAWLYGWFLAFQRAAPSPEWAEALFRHAVVRPHWFLRPANVHPFVSDAVVDEHVDTLLPKHETFLDESLLQRPGPLPPKLSARVVDLGPKATWMPNQPVGHRLHPSVLRRLEEPWEAHDARRLKWQRELSLRIRLFQSLDAPIPTKP